MAHFSFSSFSFLIPFLFFNPLSSQADPEAEKKDEADPANQDEVLLPEMQFSFFPLFKRPFHNF